MLYVGDREIAGSDDHEGFVAGRYRDGTYSDIWTDVRAGPAPAFATYAPSCECGWRGSDHAADQAGFAEARTEWFQGHFLPFAERVSGRAVSDGVGQEQILDPTGDPSAGVHPAVISVVDAHLGGIR